MIARGFVAALAFAALVGPAAAQGAAQGTAKPTPTVGAVLEACAADMKSRCGAEPLSLGRVSACLRRNRESLAPGCQSFVAELRPARAGRGESLRPAREAVTKACEADVKAACGDNLSNRARGQCFRSNPDKMSEGCRSAMAELRRLQGESRRQRQAGAN
ncbi:hypothetical protein [Salinarimonas soli]|uniref:Cysteine rich repeat-containing protein n=1 Tax=Salinarimonas soli TaxID=1638099 RepID=A0A5B2V992_9HYPH|nr:hypothetical protein [Salinarimonas soli]KAA2235020.1 hypothetical protein F0L46_22045 [Salinarimonas soli]